MVCQTKSIQCWRTALVEGSVGAQDEEAGRSKSEEEVRARGAPVNGVILIVSGCWNRSVP